MASAAGTGRLQLRICDTLPPMTVLLAIGVLGLWEWLRPARRQPGRWGVRTLNLAIGLFNGVLLRVALPAGLATWAAIATTQLGRSPAPAWVGLLVLDLALYWQHRACHRFRPLWRLHAPHHSDTDLDLTTGLRFHPLEAGASALWKGAVILAVGIGPTTVWIFEAVLVAASCFSHANLAWSGRWARILDLVWMTPACHWVHHGLALRDQSRNLAFSITLWDWIFGTRCPGRLDQPVGLPWVPATDTESAWKFLVLPFKNIKL